MYEWEEIKQLTKKNTKMKQFESIAEGIVKTNNVYVLTEEAYKELSKYKHACKDLHGSMKSIATRISLQAATIEKILNNEE